MYESLYQYFYKKTHIQREKFDSYSNLFKLRKLNRNDFIVMEGQICYENVFVNKGCLKCYAINNEGQENIRYFAFEGKFGTALSSFINGKPSFEFIQALEKTEILSIHKEDFMNLVNSVQEVNMVYRDILEMAYITSQERIYGLQGKNALERLKWLLSYQPMIFTKLSSKVIASYLGVTPYTLSRLKAEL